MFIHNALDHLGLDILINSLEAVAVHLNKNIPGAEAETADLMGRTVFLQDSFCRGRGEGFGKGIENIRLPKSGGVYVVAAFPATNEDQLLLVTQQGQIIRTPVKGIRIAGRSTRGVVIFRIDEGDRVVSVSRLREEGNGG
jgi:DNA gyrase/topoisomerase IV subunit A